ncbi:DUF4224 domain-containing protein [Salinisphaera sp. G21_0]|uniref:DUF4224 domain-containing protein n=1 Tax=Salinisphaera sp. G21_0 TaxID=2821094 RepID=UPI001ADA122E|nr:DUF4224 domain-containing protein [Salinisphaera sp. G21_0]MBO9484321.1 DUF4224 domain-containing protein [Salinisphaera sp. G21_0]
MDKFSEQLITEEQLKAWLGFKQRSALMKWLDKEAIPYRLGNKGVIATTLNSLEANQLRKAEEKAVPRFLNGRKS